MTNAPTKRGIGVECAVCYRTKAPRGRDPGMHHYGCDRECAGYYEPPHVGSLWPGETDAEFGYPCGDDGTEPMPARYHVACAIEFVCKLFGARTCDHCDRVALCRETSADTLQCSLCDAEAERDYGIRPVRTLGTIDGPM